jgi:hypothetical protein
LCFPVVSTLVGAGLVAGAVVGGTLAGWGAAVVAAGEAPPVKAGDEDASPAEFGAVGAADDAAGDDPADEEDDDDDAEGPDAADEGACVAPPPVWP